MSCVMHGTDVTFRFEHIDKELKSHHSLAPLQHRKGVKFIMLQLTGDTSPDVYKLSRIMSRCCKWGAHFYPTRDISHYTEISTTWTQYYKIMIIMPGRRIIFGVAKGGNPTTRTPTARTLFGFDCPKSYLSMQSPFQVTQITLTDRVTTSSGAKRQEAARSDGTSGSYTTRC